MSQCCTYQVVDHQVIFDPKVFKEQYPEFASSPDGVLTRFWCQAVILLDNTKNSVVKDTCVRGTLLSLLVAHIACLFYGVNGQSPSDLVGRINSAKEGTVSVNTDLPGITAGSAWYAQTKYGLEYYELTRTFRTFRYIKGSSPSGYPHSYYRRF